MAKQFNTEVLVKKLKSVSNTQDSIPMLSLWIIHHKSHHRKIVDTWLDMVKKSKIHHRLTLLYLCNDVVQHCKRKNAPVYKESFSDVLVEAISHLRDSSIKSNVERVVKIWAKRAIYETDFTDQLLAALITNRAPEKLRTKLLVEYKTSSLIDKIRRFKDEEDKIESDQSKLKVLRMDVSNSDAIRNLKDKIGGEKFSQDFEESATQLESFLSHYEKCIEDRKKLLDLLEQGTVYYHAQYHEAKIVVNAYKSFEDRVRKMKRGIDKVKMRFRSSPNMIRNSFEFVENNIHERTPSRVVTMEAEFTATSLPVPVETISRIPKQPEENVLNVLANSLESFQSENQSTAESLKRVISGFVSRPGMRGASADNNAASAGNEYGNRKLTVVRPVMNFSNENRSGPEHGRLYPPEEDESPPSPQGSPELRISSPQREPLDSRLADLFSEAGVTASNKEEPTDNLASDSDTDSELTKINVTEVANENNSLPNSGDFHNTPRPDIVLTPVVAKQTETPVPLASSSNQSIPVIASIPRMAAPVDDGSSTPTLDEDPYSSAAPRNFYQAPQFSSDAFSFLSKIMVNAVKTDASTSVTAISSTTQVITPTVPTPWLVTQPQINATSISTPSWPAPTPPPSTNPWPTTPTPPIMPPFPFLWPPKADSSLPSPWTTAINTNLPAPWNPVSAPPASLAVNNQQTTSQTPPLPPLQPPPQPPNYQVSASPLEVSSAPLQSVQLSPPALEQNPPELPPVKRSKWDVKDTEYRVKKVEKQRNSSTDSSHPPTPVEKRRNSNLITLSTQGQDSRLPLPPETSHTATSLHSSLSTSSAAMEGMPLLEHTRHCMTEQQPMPMHPETAQEWHNKSEVIEAEDGVVEPPRKCYDASGMLITSPPELLRAKGRKADALEQHEKDEPLHKPAIFRHNSHPPQRHDPPRNSHRLLRPRAPLLPVAPRGRFSLQPPMSHKRFPTPFTHGEARPRLPQSRPVVADRRRSAENELINLELAMVEEEQFEDENLRMEVALLEELRPPLIPRPRNWSLGTRPPLRAPHPRPRFIRQPHHLTTLRSQSRMQY